MVFFSLKLQILLLYIPLVVRYRPLNRGRESALVVWMHSLGRFLREDGGNPSQALEVIS